MACGMRSDGAGRGGRVAQKCSPRVHGTRNVFLSLAPVDSASMVSIFRGDARSFSSTTWHASTVALNCTVLDHNVADSAPSTDRTVGGPVSVAALLPGCTPRSQWRPPRPPRAVHPLPATPTRPPHAHPAHPAHYPIDACPNAEGLAPCCSRSGYGYTARRRPGREA